MLIGSVSQFLNSLMSRFVGDQCTGVGVGQPVGVAPTCSWDSAVSELVVCAAARFSKPAF